MQYKKQVKPIFLGLIGFSMIFTASLGVAQTIGAQESELPSVDFNARIKVGAINENGRSLGRDDSGDRTTLFGLFQPKLKANLGEDWSAFALAEFFAADDVVELNEDFASDQSDGYASLRELWIDYHGLSRYPGESVRFGWERFREPSSLWWDREVLLARWKMDTTRFNATLGFGERIDLLRTDDAELSPLDEGRQRYFTSVDYQWRYGHWAGFKLMHSADQVDDVNILPQQDNFRRQYTWLGVNANNDYQKFRSNLSWQYSIDLMALTGRAEHFDDNSNVYDVNVNGWAVDVGVRKRFNLKYPLIVGGHFAYASGGDGKAADNTFYQTGLQTNRSRFGGTRSITSRFGGVARLELSNVEVATLYLTQLIGEKVEWSISAHNFTRVDEYQSVRLRGISVSPQDGEADIGSEVNVLIAYFNQADRGFLSKSSVNFKAGYFDAGDAYSLMPDEGRYRLTLYFQKWF